MDEDDEKIRDAIVAGLKAAGVAAGPPEAVIPEAVIDVRVVPAAPSDASSGEGRSPLTGTSAESARQSRHQTDPT